MSNRVDEHMKPPKTEQPGRQTTLAAGQRTGARESYFGVRTALLAFASVCDSRSL